MVESIEKPSFTLLEQLGRGSTGVVYRAVLTRPVRDLAYGSPVAIKIVHPELLESSIILGRLKREVEIGIRVRSRNVVSIFGVEKYKIFGQLTLAILMELIEGVSLKDLLSNGTDFPEPLLITVARQAAKALQDIHAIGIVHRDVKPANLIMTALKRVVLTDLGIARLPDISAKVTTTGTFIGTCTYASPEQFEDTENLDPRSDIYSLGVVLYELATHVNPFRADNLIATVQAHLKGSIAPPRTLNPKISPIFEALILKMLSKDRENRPASASEILSCLDRFANPDDTTQVMG